MKLLIAAANGMSIVSSMFCMSYLYKSWWRRGAPSPLVASIAIGGITTLVTMLQFFWPALLPAMRRDATALWAGEWWRLVTPLFVQPFGVMQAVFNGAFLLVFLPISERLFGRGVWLIYFLSGIAGQAVNYWWSPRGGGSSTAAFGLMGALLMFLIRNRATVPAWYVALSGLGFCGAMLMSSLRDGHGPGLLAGAVVASALPMLQATEEAPAGKHRMNGQNSNEAAMR